MLNNIKKKTMKQIGRLIMNNTDGLYEYNKYKQWYEFIIDMIDTKMYKNTNTNENEKTIPKIYVLYNMQLEVWMRLTFKTY